MCYWLLHVSSAVTSANNVTSIFLWCLCVTVDLSHEFINKICNSPIYFLFKLDFFYILIKFVDLHYITFIKPMVGSMAQR